MIRNEVLLNIEEIKVRFQETSVFIGLVFVVLVISYDNMLLDSCTAAI